jgi:hypothetical protein
MQLFYVSRLIQIPRKVVYFIDHWSLIIAHLDMFPDKNLSFLPNLTYYFLCRFKSFGIHPGKFLNTAHENISLKLLDCINKVPFFIFSISLSKS